MLAFVETNRPFWSSITILGERYFADDIHCAGATKAAKVNSVDSDQQWFLFMLNVSVCFHVASTQQ